MHRTAFTWPGTAGSVLSANAFILLLPRAPAQSSSDADVAKSLSQSLVPLRSPRPSTPRIPDSHELAQSCLLLNLDAVLLLLVRPTCSTSERFSAQTVYNRVIQEGSLSAGLVSVHQTHYSVDALRNRIWHTSSCWFSSYSSRRSIPSTHSLSAPFAAASLSAPVLPALPPLNPGLRMRERPRLAELDLRLLRNVCTADAEEEEAASGAPCAERGYARVATGILLGGKDSAKDRHMLIRERVCVVVNLAAGSVPNFMEREKGENVPEYIAFRSRDSQTENLRYLLPDIVHAAKRARERQRAMYVHCYRGISRAPTVAAALLILLEGYGANAAVREVMRKREVACPRTEFVQMLVKLEKELKKGREETDVAEVRCMEQGVGWNAGASKDKSTDICVLQAPRGGEVLEDPVACLLMARRGRMGYVARRGACASDSLWARTVQLAYRRRDMERDFGKPEMASGEFLEEEVRLVRQGEDESVEKEFQNALAKGATKDDDLDEEDEEMESELMDDDGG